MSATFLFPDSKDFSPDLKEVARYLGYRKAAGPDVDVSALMEKAAREMQAVMKPQAVFEIFNLDIHSASSADCRIKPDNDKAVTFGQMSKTLDPEVSFADVTLHSKDLTTNLTGCSQVALLAATIGPQVDALIRKHSSYDPVYASILQATGAMFIEEVVDLVNAEIKKIAETQGLKTRPRYSPGYGDVPLEIQKEFFRLLPCTRIGLTLMDTLIMAPEKSVTAFVGLF